MATLVVDNKGSRLVQFTDRNRDRRTVRLGKISETAAEKIKGRIEKLNSASRADAAVDDSTAEWVGSLTDRMHAKLAKVGLVTERAKRSRIESATLATFIDGFIDERTDVKDATRTVYGHTRRCLVKFFGADRPLASLTKGDADEFRRYLGRPKEKKGEGLADNTVRRRSAIAKQFFQAALDKELIGQNPFAKMKGLAVRGNKTREFFVSRDTIARVIDVCPDAQWRLIIALSRYGGLRTPSEHLALRWGDIDWERGRMTVHSPKTEHHEGGDSRIIPIFPALRPYLDEVYAQAEEGTEHVITRYREPGCNLRTQLHRIIRKAGLEPWPKLFQNLRSTRETELAETYPMHVVCAWIGNSLRVAAKHYLQVTEAHFQQAGEVKSAAKSAAQQDGNELNEGEWGNSARHKSKNHGELQPFAMAEMGDEGLEPPTSTV